MTLYLGCIILFYFYYQLVELHGLARVLSHTFIHIIALVVKVLNKITAFVFQSWLDINFYIVRRGCNQGKPKPKLNSLN